MSKEDREDYNNAQHFFRYTPDDHEDSGKKGLPPNVVPVEDSEGEEPAVDHERVIPHEPAPEELKPDEESEEDTVEEPKEDEVDTRPDFLREEAPKGKTAYVKWALMHDETSEQLISDGHNAGTIRVAISELKKGGFWKGKETPSKALATQSTKRGMTVFAKGSPPEAIIDSITLPVPGGEQFVAGMKSGMSMLVLAVRIMQELAVTGAQQAQPLITMARDMRAGEAQAAGAAASAAAQEAAAQVRNDLQPVIEDMYNKTQEIQAGPREKTTLEEDMKDMIKAGMKPVFNSIMKKMIPKEEQQPTDGAIGWTVEKE